MSLTLEDVKKAFLDWRQTRPHNSARTPKILWEQVNLLIISGYSKQRICSRIGINHAQLNRYCPGVATKKRTVDSIAGPQFIAVPAVQQLEGDKTLKINFSCGDKEITVQSSLLHLEQALSAFKVLL